MASGPTIAVRCDPPTDADLLAAARRLAADLDLALHLPGAAADCDFLLTVTPARLELRQIAGDPATRGGRAVYVDLLKVDATSAAGRTARQPLAKAIGKKHQGDRLTTVIDATAGYGEDAWLLARLGYDVLGIERNPAVAALLRDGVSRAADRHPKAAGRLRVICGNAWNVNDFERSQRPDVVYLDPMFPALPGVGRKAAESKRMRILRQLVGDDTDASQLFDWAMRTATRRVVVKRPLKAPPLTDLRTAATHKGKAVRWDVYLPLSRRT